MRLFICHHNQSMLVWLLNCMEKYVGKTEGLTKRITDSHEKTVLLHKMKGQQYEWVFMALDVRRTYNPEKIEKMINLLLELEESEDHKCIWTFNREKIALNIQDIYYFHSYQRAITVYTYSEEYRINTTLSEEELALKGKGFVRVHQGYLVQKNRIKSVNRHSLTLKNGVVLPVSNRYKYKLRSCLEEYRVRNCTDG